MDKVCCAVDCSNRYEKGSRISFYRFPTDPARRARWIAAVNRKNWEPIANTCICSAHFISGSKSDDPLSPDYEPTVFSHVKTPVKKKENDAGNKDIPKKSNLTTRANGDDSGIYSQSPVMNSSQNGDPSNGDVRPPSNPTVAAGSGHLLGNGVPSNGDEHPSSNSTAAAGSGHLSGTGERVRSGDVLNSDQSSDNLHSDNDVQVTDLEETSHVSDDNSSSQQQEETSSEAETLSQLSTAFSSDEEIDESRDEALLFPIQERGGPGRSQFVSGEWRFSLEQYKYYRHAPLRPLTLLSGL